ncbi:MAG: threonine/serine exporter family protein [Fusobacterium sp. JB021]|nr:threonine/serine exporter family protein [Fusobacterium sp. JB020]MDP0493714.1 threonine/serine exporter family protein [Fusobacterium sp. JB021]MDP0505672.1 threonine/serine exporter family protein [Fusobacterium sp. JB019]
MGCKCSEYEVLELVSFVGKLYLKNGAEVYKTEEIICTIGKNFGYEVETFSTLTCIVVSLSGRDKEYRSKVTRINSRDLNIQKLHLVNNLINNIENYSYKDFYREMTKVNDNYFLEFHRYVIGCVIVGMSFGIVFGGGKSEAIVGAFGGFFLSLATSFFNKYKINGVLVNIAGSAACTTVACVATYLGYTEKTSIIIIACLMILVPGLAFANAMRDFIAGDLMAGSSRLMEVIMVAASLSVGVGLVFKIFTFMGGVIY